MAGLSFLVPTDADVDLEVPETVGVLVPAEPAAAVEVPAATEATNLAH